MSKEHLAEFTNSFRVASGGIFGLASAGKDLILKVPRPVVSGRPDPDIALGRKMCEEALELSRSLRDYLDGQ